MAEPLADDFLHAFGNADVLDTDVGSPLPDGVLIDRAPLGEAHQHLDREDRLAAGLLVYRDSELARLFVERLARRALDEIGDTRSVKAAQRDAIDAFRATQVCEQRTEGMRPIDLRVAVRPDDEQIEVPIAAQHMTEHEQSRFCGPVQVVEHEQGWRDLRLRFEPAGDRFEEQVPLGLGVACGGSESRKPLREFGNEPAELAGSWAEERGKRSAGGVPHDVRECFDEWLIRNAEAVVATTQEDEA